MMSFFKKILPPKNDQSDVKIKSNDTHVLMEVLAKQDELNATKSAERIPPEIKKHDADKKYLKQLLEFNTELENDIEFFKNDILIGKEEVEKVKKSISDARKIQLDLIQKRSQLLKIQQSVHSEPDQKLVTLLRSHNEYIEKEICDLLNEIILSEDIETHKKDELNKLRTQNKKLFEEKQKIINSKGNQTPRKKVLPAPLKIKNVAEETLQ